jgi:alkylation response protein AidB-like acyl-CoA dehydrogenase
VPASQMVGNPGDGWALAMTVVGHEREPSTLGYAARYEKTVNQLARKSAATTSDELAWATVQVQVLRQHVRRRLSEQLDGISHGPEGSIDKLLMTWVEQSVGHAVLAQTGTTDPDLFNTYLYSRSQSVMGGTSQIQKNIIAGRILRMAV